MRGSAASTCAANATDKTYIATCLDRGDCWFGTKRKAIATIGYRW